MSNITEVLINVYNCARWRTTGHATYSAYTEVSEGYFMEVPIKREIIEVPCIAFMEFMNHSDADSIIVHLNNPKGCRSYYTSLDAIMKSALFSNFKSDRLIEVQMREAPNTVYYVSYGTVFSKELYPIMMCSWVIDNTDPNTVKAIRPILRLDPNYFINKNDKMLRYVMNKIPTEALSYIDYSPSGLNSSRRFSVKIEIDESPFKVHKTPYPNVDTTNESLINEALNHISEFTWT